MCRRVAKNLERFRVLFRKNAKRRVFFQRPSKVDQITVGLGHQCGISETRADRLRDIERGRALRNVLDATVGKLDVNAVGHGNIQYKTVASTRTNYSTQRTQSLTGEYKSRVRIERGPH